MSSNIVWNNWRDKLKDASFKDVPFKILSTTSEGGRRSVLHQYPFDDVPYWEDLGKEANTYQVQAYVVANASNQFDYFAERDNLIFMLEQEGPGTLIHPFLGSKQVGVQGKYKLDESFAEGGIARFTITFVDAGRAAQPATGIAPSSGQVDAACSTLVTKATNPVSDMLTKAANARDAARKYALATQAAIQGATNMVNNVYSTLTTIQTDVVGAISFAQTTLAQLRGTFVAIVGFPDKFVAAIKSTLDTYSSLGAGLSSSDTSVVKSALRMSEVSSTVSSVPVAVVDASGRAEEYSMQQAMDEANMAGGLAEAIRAASLVTYKSYDQTQTMLDDLIAAIDRVLNHVGSHSQNDELMAAIEALRPLITNLLISKGANLPATKLIELPTDTQPTLVLAQRLYGDVTRDQEVIDMNPIPMRHPGFPVPGGVALVLSS